LPADGVDDGQGLPERGEGGGVLGCAGFGGGHRRVRHVQVGDPGDPGVPPRGEVGVGVPGPDEVPADVGPTPQGVDPVQAGQGLVDHEEVAGQHQAAPVGQRPGLAVGGSDAELGVQHRVRAGGIHPEHDGVLGDEDPQPPRVAGLTLDLFVDPPRGLVGVHMCRGGVAGADRGLHRLQQTGQCLEHPGQGALGDGQSGDTSWISSQVSRCE